MGFLGVEVRTEGEAPVRSCDLLLWPRAVPFLVFVKVVPYTVLYIVYNTAHYKYSV